MAMYLRDLFNENQQVNGIMYFIDMTGVEMKHLTYFGVEKSPQMIKLWQVRRRHVITYIPSRGYGFTTWCMALCVKRYKGTLVLII